MILKALLTLGLCFFQKIENAQITPTFDGMTCPTNWAVGLTSLQVEIIDPAPVVTSTAVVNVTYKTNTETKSCLLDVETSSCDKTPFLCTDGVFSNIECSAANPLNITWMVPAPLAAEHNNAMITVSHSDGRISGWTDAEYTLNVINGPTSLDNNAETSSDAHVYNDVANFTCSTGFIGSSFDRILSACAEWTKRSTDADNDCIAIVSGSGELTGGQIAGIVTGTTLGVACLAGIVLFVKFSSNSGEADTKEKHGRGSKVDPAPENL